MYQEKEAHYAHVFKSINNMVTNEVKKIFVSQIIFKLLIKAKTPLKRILPPAKSPVNDFLRSKYKL